MIGVDIVQIERIKKAADSSDSFLRIFTTAELKYIRSKTHQYQTMAGIFAAKEAVAKANGSGLTAHPSKIEVSHDKNGCPSAVLDGTKFYVSISHDGDYAVAIAQKEF